MCPGNYLALPRSVHHSSFACAIELQDLRTYLLQKCSLSLIMIDVQRKEGGGELFLMQLLSFFTVGREASGQPVSSKLPPSREACVAAIQSLQTSVPSNFQLDVKACFYHFSRRGRFFCDFHSSRHSFVIFLWRC